MVTGPRHCGIRVEARPPRAEQHELGVAEIEEHAVVCGLDLLQRFRSQLVEQGCQLCNALEDVFFEQNITDLAREAGEEEIIG